MGANVKIEDLNDIIRHKGNLRVECDCGRAKTVDARAMARWYACHGWSTSISQLGRHLYCTRCWGRPATWRMTGERPNAPNIFPTDEMGWKVLVKRLRNQ